MTLNQIFTNPNINIQLQTCRYHILYSKNGYSKGKMVGEKESIINTFSWNKIKFDEEEPIRGII